MNYKYDMHIHTGLSPCADKDMSPNNILNMALVSELDIIAVTDHNSALNLSALNAAAKGRDILLINGIELETEEEIHLLCYFKNLEAAQEFGDIVYKSMPKIKNREDIFGRQIVYDELDNEIREEEFLLSAASGLSLEKAVALCRSLHGLPVPAHIDRPSNSILSQLGVIPAENNFSAVEFSKRVDILTPPEIYLEYFRKYNILASSDAHYLENIGERNSFIDLNEKSAAELFEKLKRRADE